METLFGALLLGLSLFMVALGARLVVRHAPVLATLLGMSGFLTGFLVIGVVSVFPELSIAVISGLQGIPSLGLGTLYGSNVADLTLVLGIAALFARKGLRIRSDFLKDDLILIAPLLLPVFLGVDGEFSRIDGGMLIAVGLLLFFFLYWKGRRTPLKAPAPAGGASLRKSVALFALGLAALVGGAYATVLFAGEVAGFLSLPEVLMGISFVTLGTLLPELTFSMKAARAEQGELVLGDILGIVITDITFVLGLMAMLSPFTFDPELVSLTGFAMVFAAMVSISFMKSGRLLSKTEGVVLILLYVFFIATAFTLEGGAAGT